MARQQKLIKEIPVFWRPEFIPFYLLEKEKYGLNDKEALIYGFVRHFLKNCSGRFFFTNEQLRYAIGMKTGRIETISEIVGKLTKKCPEITLSYQFRKDGGKVRIVGYLGGGGLTLKRNSELRKNVSNREYSKEYIKERELRPLFEEKITIEDNNPNKTQLLEEKFKFLDYWTEKSEGGRKERWQMEKVFDVCRRWNTWLGRVKKDVKEYKKPEIRTSGGMSTIKEVIAQRK